MFLGCIHKLQPTGYELPVLLQIQFQVGDMSSLSIYKFISVVFKMSQIYGLSMTYLRRMYGACMTEAGSKTKDITVYREC